MEAVAHRGQHVVLADPDQPGEGDQFADPLGELGPPAGGLAGEYGASQLRQALVAQLLVAAQRGSS